MSLWVPVSLTGKVADICVRDLGFSPYLYQKTDWCLGLMIKSYYQERTSYVETLSLSQKKKKKKIYIYIYVYYIYCINELILSLEARVTKLDTIREFDTTRYEINKLWVEC